MKIHSIISKKINFKRTSYIALSLALVFIANKSWGQVSSYTFQQTTGTYTPIAGTAIFGSTTWDDNAIVNLGIPFTFNFNGVCYNNLNVSCNGFITFGATAPATNEYNPISGTTAYSGAVSALGRDLVNNGADVTYTTTGTAPNRIFIVQWNNARRYQGSARNGNYNFQIRLYETTNLVQVMYNVATSTYNTNIEVQIGLRGATNADFNNRTSTTNFSATTAGGANNSTVRTRNTAALNPTAGLTFTWTPPVTTVANYISYTVGLPTVCEGDNYSASVTVQNIGTATWTDGAGPADFNIGIKWDAEADYFVRVDAGNLASCATATYNFNITAPAPTSTHLNFNVVQEGVSWFGGNYQTTPITVLATPVISGTLNACVGGTSDLTTADPDWTGLPTGGTVSTVGTERIHSFTTSGTFNTPQAISGARVLVVGGGGGGGSNGGGGGGAGGLVHNTSVAIASGNTTATVGTGGACCGSPAGNGVGSAFGAITAGGGGGGASRDAGAGGQNGGSGGGGGGATAAPRHLGGTGTVGQGNNGGNGTTPDPGCFASGGGGGGAGGVGGLGTNDLAGVGGAGLANDITGVSLFYAAGGGGGLTGFPGCGASVAPNPGGSAGGSGIGGNGENSAGTANTGSGGGAERDGATGVVIVRYYAPTWTSSNPAVASVNSLTGLVTAVAAGTTIITYTSASGCSDSETFTVDAPSTIPSSITGAPSTICPGNSITLTQVGGTGSFEWFTGSCGGTAAGTGNSISVSPTATTTYYVRGAANGSCPATSCVNGTITLGAQGSALGNDAESATCTVTENNWVHFYHSSGRLLASVNSGGQNLGNVTVTSYVDGSPVLLDACSEIGNPLYATSYMQRHWVITPSFQPVTPVQVRLPFTNTELGNLSGASILNSNTNDNVTIIGDVLLSKYAGPSNVDNNGPNNCIAMGGNEGTTLHGQTANGLTTAYSTVAAAQYIDYTIPSFSEFWLHGSTNNSPLPVELTSFTADCDESGRVELKWVTSSEYNASHFVLEKSNDAGTWGELETVDAVGNSTIVNYYSAVDQNARGTNYYRLSQVDMDGTTKVYNSVATNCGATKYGFSLFPNPATSIVTLELNQKIESDNVYVGFYDVHGKMIKRFDVQQDVDNHVYVNIEDLTPGYYIVRLNDGQNDTQPVRFVKQ